MSIVPARQLGLWFALGLHSRVPTRTGDSFRNFYLFGFRYTREIQTDRGLGVDYLIDVVPLAVSTRMPDYADQTVPCSATCSLSLEARQTWHTAVGLGIAPLGLQLRMARSKPVQPYLNINGGILWFRRRIPDPDGTKLNFIAQFGTGVQIRMRPHYQIMLGYQYHHTSNGGLGTINPGLDSWMVLVGMSRALSSTNRIPLRQ